MTDGKRSGVTMASEGGRIAYFYVDDPSVLLQAPRVSPRLSGCICWSGM